MLGTHKLQLYSIVHVSTTISHKIYTTLLLIIAYTIYYKITIDVLSVKRRINIIESYCFHQEHYEL